MINAVRLAWIAGVMSVVVSTTASAQQFMTQKELLATFPGSTVYAVSNQDNKTQWAQAYGKGRKKGKIAGNWGGKAYKAEWYVDGDKWCEDTGDWQGCFQFVRINEKELKPYKDGKPQKNNWKIK